MKIYTKSQIKEASEIQIDDLDPSARATFNQISAILKSEIKYSTPFIFGGVKGYIAHFPRNGNMHDDNVRFYKELIVTLAKIPGFRWIESDDESIQVGF